MKKLFIFVIFMFLLMPSSSASARTIQGYFYIGSRTANINGNVIVMDVAPFVKDNRTYLPIRYVAQAIGISEDNIEWDQQNQEVILRKNFKSAVFRIGSDYMTLGGLGIPVELDGKPIKIDAAPLIVGGRTCLPIAIVAQNFGSIASWNDATQQVAIYDGQYLLPSVLVQSDNQEIIDLANSIVEGLTNDMEKSRAIHDWMVNNIDYDYAASRTGKYGDWSALGTLHKKTGVCSGYSNLNAALHRALGIEAKVIDGVVSHSIAGEGWNDHAWNEIYIEDRWVTVDTTWDYGLGGDEYFDPSLEVFSRDHRKINDTNL